MPARPRPRRTPPLRNTAPSSTAGPQTSLSPSPSSSLSPRLTHACITLGTPARGGGTCPTAGREGALDKHIFLLETDAPVSSRGTPACLFQQPRGPGGSELFQHCLAHGRCSVTCLLMRPRKCLCKDSTLARETSRAKGVWVLGVPYLPQSRASGVINPLPGQIPVLGGAELKPPRETPRHFTHTLPPTHSPKRGSMYVPRVISFPTRKLMPHLSRPPALSQAHPWVLSCFHSVRLFAIPRTVTLQAPPSVGFSRQECWSGLPFPSPGDLPHPGIKPRSPASLALAGGFWEVRVFICIFYSFSNSFPT